MDCCKVLLLLFGLLIQSEIGFSAHSTNLVEEGINVYKDIVSNLDNGIHDLKSISSMSNIGQSIKNLESQMGSSERSALNVIIGINNDASVAIRAARGVVSKLKGSSDTVLTVLNKGKNEARLNEAINSYVQESKLISPAVDTAVAKLTTVSAKAVRVDAAITTLRNWAANKKTQKVNEERAKIKAERTKAYAAAAACLAWGPFAIFTCPTAYGIAAGITEGKTVKDIENRYDSAIREFDNMKNEVDKVEAKTKALVGRVDSDKIKLVGIQSQLDKAEREGRLTIKYTTIFFDKFKNGISDLLRKCVSYLARN